MSYLWAKGRYPILLLLLAFWIAVIVVFWTIALPISGAVVIVALASRSSRHKEARGPGAAEQS